MSQHDASGLRGAMTEQTSGKPTADHPLAAEIERHGRALLAMAAEIRARASGEAPQNEELLDVGTIAQMMETTKGAARMKILEPDARSSEAHASSRRGARSIDFIIGDDLARAPACVCASD